MRLPTLPTVLMLMLAAGPVRAQTDPDAVIAQDAVRLFGTACLQHYPDPAAMTHWLRAHDLKPLELAATERARLTGGQPGQVYSVPLHGVRYLLVVARDNLCSLYVKRVDPARALAALAALRSGLTESGALHESVHTERHASPTGTLITRHFSYATAGGREVLMLAVSTSTSTQGFYQFAASASMANRRPPAPAPARSG